MNDLVEATVHGDREEDDEAGSKFDEKMVNIFGFNVTGNMLREIKCIRLHSSVVRAYDCRSCCPVFEPRWGLLFRP